MDVILTKNHLPPVDGTSIEAVRNRLPDLRKIFAKQLVLKDPALERQLTFDLVQLLNGLDPHGL